LALPGSATNPINHLFIVKLFGKQNLNDKTAA